MNKSKTIGKLASALSQLQGAMHDVVRDTSGYGYKYADLSQVLEATRPLLARFGLSISQLIEKRDNEVGIQTILMHESDEFLASYFGMPVDISMSPVNGQGKPKMNIFQVAGSAMTYYRRYAWAAIIGLAQVDDDVALREPPAAPAPAPVRAQPAQDPVLRAEINMLMKRYPSYDKYVKGRLKEKNQTLDGLSNKGLEKGIAEAAKYITEGPDTHAATLS